MASSFNLSITLSMSSSMSLRASLNCKAKAVSTTSEEALRLILEDMDKVMERLKELAINHKRTLMMGRTHGVHAEPITLGLKFLSWYEELKRNRERLLQALENISYGKLSGAVGTYSNLLPEVEKLALEDLDLKWSHLYRCSKMTAKRLIQLSRCLSPISSISSKRFSQSTKS